MHSKQRGLQEFQTSRPDGEATALWHPCRLAGRCHVEDVQDIFVKKKTLIVENLILLLKKLLITLSLHMSGDRLKC